MEHNSVCVGVHTTQTESKKTVLRHCLSLKQPQKYGGIEEYALPSPARTPKLQLTAE